MRKIYFLTNYMTLLGFNNFQMLHKKLFSCSLKTFSDKCANIEIKAYESFKKMSATITTLDNTIAVYVE